MAEEDWFQFFEDYQPETVSILTFSFNTKSVRICGSMIDDRNCDVANFWPEFVKIIEQINPVVVAIGFQENVRSDLLPKEMDSLQYSLFGQKRLSGLHLSVYLRSDAKADIVKEFSAEVYRKEAVAIYLTLSNNTRIAIINVHLPFDEKSLIESTQKQDIYIRMNAVSLQNISLNNIYRKLVFNSPAQPNYVILMGDLNYRMRPFQNWSAQESGQLILENLGRYIKHDELTIEMKGGNIYSMNEGIQNLGPIFPPTCKMLKGRFNGSDVRLEDYNLGKYDARVPSYCDRILYQSYGNVPEMVCLLYDRLDYGIMNKSDHAGVYAVFSFI